jgi:hypothetical protein
LFDLDTQREKSANQSAKSSIEPSLRTLSKYHMARYILSFNTPAITLVNNARLFKKRRSFRVEVSNDDSSAASSSRNALGDEIRLLVADFGVDLQIDQYVIIIVNVR